MALLDPSSFKNVNLRPPRFVSHIMQWGGFLPDMPGAHACWYYCRCAIQMMKKVDSGADYEGETDHQQMLNNLAVSVTALYRLEDPDKFLMFMPYVKAEAMRMELEWDIRIEHPAAANWVRKDNS